MFIEQLLCGRQFDAVVKSAGSVRKVLHLYPESIAH